MKKSILLCFLASLFFGSNAYGAAMTVPQQLSKYVSSIDLSYDGIWYTTPTAIQVPSLTGVPYFINDPNYLKFDLPQILVKSTLFQTDNVGASRSNDRYTIKFKATCKVFVAFLTSKESIYLGLLPDFTKVSDKIIGKKSDGSSWGNFTLMMRTFKKNQEFQIGIVAGNPSIPNAQTGENGFFIFIQPLVTPDEIRNALAASKPKAASSKTAPKTTGQPKAADKSKKGK